MKRFACLVLAVALAVPSIAAARGIEESEVGASDAGAAEVSKEKATAMEPVSEPAGVMLEGRKGSFRVGVIGPGFAVANEGIGPMMEMGLEGEYFFFERLSAGLQIDVATEFDDYAILSFLPYVRYVFDLDSHPRWSIYVQGGGGPALINGDNVVADIAIPGGGFWWQWTEKVSIGADAWFHIFVRDNTAVGFSIAPALRYQF